MKTWFRRYWPRIIALAPLCWASLRLFLRWPMLMVGIAAIPIEEFISKKFQLSPVVSKLVGFLIFAGLALISWQIGEVIVFLAAWAILLELQLLVQCIQARMSQRKELVWAAS